MSGFLLRGIFILNAPSLARVVFNPNKKRKQKQNQKTKTFSEKTFLWE